MPNIRIESGSARPGGATPLLDHQIAQAEEQVTKQRETIDRLVAEGHEVRDARKHLIVMLDDLALLLRRRTSGT
ncbi:MAG: hypothetical protein M3R18_00200 [Pseudomonadota bacterium]|nr:hypothetical protein [Pseudomonadota bacterium]